MKSLSTLDLRVPSLGIRHTKNLFGGYYGGYLNPSICYGDVSGHTNNSDYLWFVLWSQANYHQGGDDDYGGGSGGETGGIYNGQYNQNHNGYSFDSSISAGDRAIITSAMESLPEVLQNQNVKIIIDSHVIEELNPYKAGYANFDVEGGNACFLYKGQVVKIDGENVTIAEDTIYLRSADVAFKALWEESLHQWQHYNCIQNSFQSPDLVNNGMEVQADIIKGLMAFINGEIEGSQLLSDDIINALLDENNIYYDYITGRLNVISFSSYLNSHLTPPEGYDFCWEEVLSMFFSYSSYPSGSMSY